MLEDKGLCLYFMFIFKNYTRRWLLQEKINRSIKDSIFLSNLFCAFGTDGGGGGAKCHFCIDIYIFRKVILVTSVIFQLESKFIFILSSGIEEHATRRTSVIAIPYNIAMVRVCSVSACFSCTRHHIGNRHICGSSFAALPRSGLI